jgi:hypothetical protein
MSDTVTITGDQAEVKKDAGGLKEGVVYTQILYVFPDHRVNAPSPFASESFLFSEGQGVMYEGMGGDTIEFAGTTTTFIPKGWIRRDVIRGRYDATAKRLRPLNNVAQFPSAPRE